jgi:hypothetical protein
MALSRTTGTGDGVQTDFSTPPYISKTHITVKVNGVTTTDFIWIGAQMIRFNSPPADGAPILIQRSTSPGARLVDYTTPGNLSEEDLDADSLQAFYLAQEAQDAVQDAIDAVAGSGNVPSPSGGDVGKFLRATGSGVFSWQPFVIIKSMISDATAWAINWLGLADAAAARSELGLGSAALLNETSPTFGWKLLSSVTVTTPVAAVDFTSGIDDTYDTYLIEMTNVSPSVNGAALGFRVSEDGGSTFKAGTSDYHHTRITNSNGGAVSPGGGFANYNHLLNLANGANDSISGELRVYAPGTSGKWKTMSFIGTAADSTFMSTVCQAGSYKGSTNPINGFRVLMMSGNIASGTFRLYGRRK